MRRISPLILCLALLSSFGGRQAHAAEENNFVDVVQIGAKIEDENGKVVVASVRPQGPADSAGVKTGDFIVSLDGNATSSKKQVTAAIATMRTPSPFPIIVERRGTRITLNIEPQMRKVRPTEVAISRHINIEDKRMTVAIIVSEVRNSGPSVSNEWADSIRNDLLSQSESGLLGAFGKINNFSIVDRSRLKNVLNEMNISQTGLISDKARVKVGEMTGATHIIDVSLSRYPGENDRKEDKYSCRLIEIESGKVLAVDFITTRY